MYSNKEFQWNRVRWISPDSGQQIPEKCCNKDCNNELSENEVPLRLWANIGEFLEGVVVNNPDTSLPLFS